MKLVEVQATKEFADTFLPDIFFKMAVNSVLDATPGFDLVRCKDCKHRYYHKWDEEYYCKHGCGLADCVKSDDFCPYGERKAE